jgi:outer membrane protein assembly factor BamA
VRVEPAVDRTQARVGVVFAIQEGPQQLLQNVTVVGNRSIDTDVITRAMDLPVGEPLSANAWLQSRTRLFDTNLFRRVDVTTEPIEEGSAIGIQPTRLRVAVEEWPALRIRYGVQVAEQRPEDSTDGRDLAPGLSADVTRRTLFGRAVSVGGAVEIQRRERLVRLFMNSPTTFGLPVQSLLTAERSHRNFAADTFVTNSDSVAWEQRVRLHPSLQLSYAYRFERDHTFDTAVSDDPFLPPFDITVNIARLTGSAAFDTRDDPYDSTRGWLMSSSLELSPTSLGSDVSFVRLINQGYYFRPWRKLVFASAARLGIVNPLGGQTLIPSELFFSGGSRSVRGVEEDTLGPQDFFGFPEGGRALVVLNQEARFPIYRWVRGVGFVDAGNVFEAPRSIDLGKLVVSYGGGLRIATPFALLRIDYGRLRENSTAVRGYQWTFGIGQTF